jgi:hypothetical protein
MSISALEDRIIATKLTNSFDTAEDYIPQMANLVTGDAFVAVENPVKPGLEIVAFREGRLVHYFQDSTSASGWGEDETAIPGAPGAEVRKLGAFYQDGDLFVLVGFLMSRPLEPTYQTIALKRSPNGDWTPNPFPALEPSLKLASKVDVYRDPQGRHYIYGVSINGAVGTLFVGYQSSVNGPWELKFQHELASTYKLKQWTLVNSVAPDVFAWLRIEDGTTGNREPRFFIRGCKWDGTRLVFSGDEDRRINMSLRGFNRAEFAVVTPLPAANGARGFLLKTINNELHYVWSYDAHVGSLQWNRGDGQPNGVTHFGVAAVGPGRSCVVFASNGKELWIRRQNGTGSQGEARFSNWVHLAEQATSLACPAASESPVVAVVNPSGILHLTQDHSNGSWHETLVQAPIESLTKFDRITSHALNLTALDVYGIAVPNVEVRIFSRISAPLLVNGAAATATSTVPIAARTDYAGRVQIRARASNLTAPPIEVNVPDFMRPEERAPYSADLTLLRRLAGKDENYPVDAEALKTRGLLPSTMSPREMDEAAAFVKRAGEAMLGAQSGALNFDAQLDTANAPDAGWEFLVRQDKTVSVRPLSTAEFQQMQLDSAALEIAPSSAADGFGDLVRYLKNLWDKVSKVIVRFVDDVVHVSFDAIKLVLRAASDIANVVVAAFKQFRGAVSDVTGAMLDWLKSLFGWEDIMNTKRVIRRCTDVFLDTLQHSLDEDAQELIESNFKSLRERSAGEFRKVREYFEGTEHKSLLGIAKANGVDSLTDSATRQHFEAQSVRCNYILNAITNAGPLPAQSHPAGAQLSSELEEFVRILRTHTDDTALQESLERFRVAALAVIKNGDFSKILGSSLLLLLDLTDQVVQRAIILTEAVLRLVLRFLSLALRKIRELLNEPLPIPILAPLYLSLADKDLDAPGLSLLEIAALAVAVPATVVYKLMKEGEAPFTRDQVVTLNATKTPFQGIKDLVNGPTEIETATDIWEQIEKPLDQIGSSNFLFGGMLTAFGDGFAIWEIKPEANMLSRFSLLCTAIVRGCGIPWLVRYHLNRDKKNTDFVRFIINVGGWISAGLALVGVLASLTGVPADDVLHIVACILGICQIPIGIVLLVMCSVQNEGVRPILGGIAAVIAPLPSLARVFRPAAKGIVEPEWKILCTLIISGAGLAGAGGAGSLRLFTGYFGAFLLG